MRSGRARHHRFSALARRRHGAVGGTFTPTLRHRRRARPLVRNGRFLPRRPRMPVGDAGRGSEPPRLGLGRPSMKREQIFEFFRRLAEENPSPTTELEFENPYTLLVAVVLSAQATDASV